MKKITSFLMMMVLCCIGAYAQGAKEYADKIIKIGTQQTEMVPGEWYFLHTPRNPNQSVTCDDYAIDGMIQAKGGLVYDNTSNVCVSTTTVIDELTAEEGVSSRDYLKMLVRFVAVEGQEGAYSIQFGTGNWIGHNDGGNNNDGTLCGFFLRRPCDLLEFTLVIAPELLDAVRELDLVLLRLLFSLGGRRIRFLFGYRRLGGFGNLLFVICHYVLPPVCLLLGFLVQRVLAAESAVLLELESVGVVLLVLHCVVVSLFAVAAC
jgi:hypothetical protein